MTLKDIFDYVNKNNEAIDLFVDKITWQPVRPPVKLTEEGNKYFADALNLEVDNYVIKGAQEDYELLKKYGYGGKLSLANTLLKALNGFCPEYYYNKWIKK